MKTLGFFTQNELDLVVGNKRRRERLEGRVLPTGVRVKTFGQESIIFPEFAAAALIVERPSEEDTALLSQMGAAAQSLYETTSFRALAVVLRAALYKRKGWTLTFLAETLLEQARDDLLEWRQEVTEAEQRLAELGIVTRLDVGRIADISNQGYRIVLDDDVITCGLNASRSRLAVGTWVTRDLVELGARKGEVLVPTVAPDTIPAMESVAVGEKQDEAMLSNVSFQPVVVPYVRDEFNGEMDTEGDVVRPKRRLRVRSNKALYANANTMARSHRTPPAR